MSGFVSILLCTSLLLGLTLAYSGEFVPKSVYLIDNAGHQSPVVYLRNRRNADLIPILRRLKRSSSGAGSSASSFASASAGSGANFPSAEFEQLFQKLFKSIFDAANVQPGGFAHSFSGASGLPGFQAGSVPDFGKLAAGFANGIPDPAQAYQGPILFSRFGEDTGNGVKVSGSAQGPNGAFSSSSSSIDSDGKIKYSVKSGKY